MVVARPPAHGALTRPPVPHDPPTDYDIAQADQYIAHARRFVQGISFLVVPLTFATCLSEPNH